jgi:ABC-type Mn2+/Zn2+ transport system ATPase subunit
MIAPAIPHVAARTTLASPVLEARELTVTYRETVALENVSFTIRRGDYIAVIGPNGAGKSTLIKAVLGMLPITSGDIHLHTPNGTPPGYVPQHEAVNLEFPVTVRDVVMMGRHRQIGWLRMPARRDRVAVDDALARVGLSALANRQIGELSGGQRRRAFIARALAQEADLLLLDEPMSGVDVDGQIALMEVLDALNRDGLTILMTTHDLDLAFRRFGRVMALRRCLVAFGTPAEVYTPEVLMQVYDRVLTTWADGERVKVLIDEHGCPDC